MEIGASSSAHYLPPQLTELRGARNSAREIPGAQDNTAAINQERKENNNQRPAFASNPESLKAADTTTANQVQISRSTLRSEDQSASQTDETQRARQQPATAATGGSIKMDVEDGDRVLKVFDSKDVLIYQLPPKGALMLIKAQEHAQQSQVQTSA